MGPSRGSVLESISAMYCSFIVHSLVSDRGPFVVQTDWNWELSRFAFCRVSVISLSLCLSGGLSEKQKCVNITGGTIKP